MGLDMRAEKVYNKHKNLKISGSCSLVTSIALAFMLAKYLAARFIAPIRLVIDRCTAIAAGKLDERILVHTNDELDQLLGAFNDMSATLAVVEQKKHEAFESLRCSKDELEIRVMQRTADFKQVNDKLSHEIAQHALQEAATMDSLTRLFNPRAVMERLEHEVARNRRSQEPFTGLVVDLDHFKSVNDTKGHDAGDSILIETGFRMKSMLRNQDSIARWGGEEFVILLPDTDLYSGRVVAEKVRRRMADMPFFVCGEEIRVTASFGVAEFGVESDINQLLKTADEAVYAAKNGGRNRVEVGGNGNGGIDGSC